MSNFFIHRPIFAWVVALTIMLAGILSIKALPVNQYPDVAAPAIQISVNYPGASAQTVQDTVVQVIEQQLNGLDGLRYISSESNADGSMAITVTFDQGTDPDIAQVQVQNKLQLATPMLPAEVQQQGIKVQKFQINFVLVASLISRDGSMSDEDLNNYIASYLQDPISRTKGVGSVMVFGSQYAMRIWLDPAKLNSYQLMPSDVVAAVQAQNVQLSSGQLGGLPTRDAVQLNATVVSKTRLKTAEQFDEILIKVNEDGSQVRLKDVARTELGGENYAISARLDGKPSTGIALRLASGANVLETVNEVKAVIGEMEPYFPAGLELSYPYDTTPVVTASIESVIHTLIEAIVLVFAIMYLFLQNIRATLIPTLAIPVVILGTFGVVYAFGFTINVMTMFAMVLAIGLLVDDAIVVVENVERVMTEDKLPPREATVKSMGQIQGALVGIALVICVVFLPMAFFAGSTGVIYRQFSITIISAMSLSALIALTFTPALCATLLKPGGHHEKKGFFGWFNRTYERGAGKYRNKVAFILRHRGAFFALYLALCGVLFFGFKQIPTAFLPDEDQGTFMVQVQLPDNATKERTDQILNQISSYFNQHEQETIDSAVYVNGFNLAGRGQKSAMIMITLKPFDQRKDESLSVFALAKRSSAFFSTIKDATIIPMVPPSITELGSSLGFDFFLQDKGGQGHEALMEARNQFLGMARAHPVLKNVRPNGLSDEPQYEVIIDDERARAHKVAITDVNDTMSVAWGSYYVNDFIDRGRVKKVFLQGEASARISPEDFNKWYVRNADGDMIPFSNFASGRWVYGSPKLERYNGLPAVEIVGEPAEGYSSGDAMKAVEEIAASLPDGFALSYTGLSYEERLSGDQAPMLYAISLIMIFLCLAALYESWSVPFSVLLVVPLGILGTVLLTLARGLSNDVFFQVGMLTVMGLAAKNAILIVEFAKDLHEKEGMSLIEAAVEAARMRLRPILMTSLAFIFGVLPMAIATGASSASQHSIGTSVVGGTLGATVLAIFFVPLFFVGVSTLFSFGKKKA